MKYIDAEKLIAEIERRKNQTERRLDNIVPIRRKDTMDEEQLAKIELRDKVDKAYLNGVLITLSDILSFITSLQQEQPVEGLDVTDFCKPIDPGIAQCIADHWWELLDDENAADKKAVKKIVKTAHKEVTRQVKEMLGKQAVEGLEEADFVEEVRQYYSNNCTWDALKQPMLSIITRCARHFAEWGAKHTKTDEEETK